MMTGYVHSKGLGLSGNQVSKSLRRVNPVNHSKRREDTVRRQNPVPYYAPRTSATNCTVIRTRSLLCSDARFSPCRSDGCSPKMVKLFSMPKKNAVIIYLHFRLVLFIVVPIFFFSIGFTILLALMTLVQYYKNGE